MKGTTLLITLLSITFVKGFSQIKNFIDQPYIETIAKVDTLVTPDRIFLEIFISEKDTKGKITLEELEAKMESTLKSIGIDTEKNLTLNDLASKLNKYLLKESDILKSKKYSLMVDNAVTAGNVLIALEKIEVSNVRINKVEYSKIDKLNLELKSKAILKAKKQAEFMCSPLNQKVGNAIFISDFSDNYPINNQDYDMNYIQRSQSYSIKEIKYADIQFDKIKVESIISVRFKLE